MDPELMVSSRCRLGLLTLLLTTCLASQQPTPQPAQQSADPVAAAVAEYARQHPFVGLSVALMRDGRVIDSQAFGDEDREAGIRASEATRYRWASISKPVTAVATTILVERGLLDLDVDVRELVPEFPEKPHVVTPRLLLTHQGGIVHYSNGPVVRRKKEYLVPNPFADVVTALDTFAESPLVCEPGSRHSYTTHGYLLLGAVVQKAAKQPFARFVEREIAIPAGMTTFRPDYQWEVIPHRAVGYRKGPGGTLVRSTDTDVSWKLAGGGYISTVRDLGRFGAALLRREFVSPEGYQALWTPVATADGKPTRYGHGFGVTTREGQRVVSHSGAQEKASTLLLLLPDAGLGVAIMTNTEGHRLQSLGEALLATLR